MKYGGYLLLISLIGCTFSPSSTEYTDIDPNDFGTSVPTIDLSSQQDTIPIPSATSINYSIDTINRDFYTVQFLINSSPIGSNNESTGSFTINPSNYPTGYHTLTVRAIASTNTRSLADGYGYEAVFFDKSWVLQFDNDPPNTIQLEEIAVENGTVYLRWDKYERINFQSYSIVRSQNNFLNGQTIIEITDPDRTEHIDYSVIDGEFDYTLTVRASNRTATSDPKSLQLQPITINNVEQIDANNTRVSWTKPELYTNFAGYELYEQFSRDRFWFSESIDDTSYTFSNLGFGSENTFVLNLPAGYKYQGYGDVIEFTLYGGTPINLPTGEIISDLSEVLYDSNRDLHIISHDLGLAQFDANTGTVVLTSDVITNDLFKTNDKIYTTAPASGIGLRGRIAQIDINTLQVDRYFEPEEMINKENFVFDLNVNAEGITSFNSGYFDNGTKGDSLIIYNLKTDTHLGTFRPGSRAKLIQDQYVFIDDTLYNINTDQLDRLFVYQVNPRSELTVEGADSFTEYYVDPNLNRLIRKTTNTLNQSSSIDEIVVPRLDRFGRIDPENSIVKFIDSSNNYVVYNYETSTIEGDFNLGEELNFGIYYSNGLLFSRNGYYLD